MYVNLTVSCHCDICELHCLLSLWRLWTSLSPVTVTHVGLTVPCHRDIRRLDCLSSLWRMWTSLSPVTVTHVNFTVSCGCGVQTEVVQARVHKSLKVWSLYADLEESFGTFKVRPMECNHMLSFTCFTVQHSYILHEKNLKRNFHKHGPWPRVYVGFVCVCVCWGSENGFSLGILVLQCAWNKHSVRRTVCPRTVSPFSWFFFKKIKRILAYCLSVFSFYYYQEIILCHTKYKWCGLLSLLHCTFPCPRNTWRD